MQDRAHFGMTLLPGQGRRFGPPAGAVGTHLLHRPSQPSQVPSSPDTFETLGNHALERMAIGTVWMPVAAS